MLLAFWIGTAAAADDWLYPVQRGEHLWGLAERFLDGHKSYGKLQQLNRIRDPKRIPPGSVLRIPLAWMRRVTSEARIVTVQGAVEIERAGAGTRAASVGDALREQDRLRTAPGAHAAIALPDGSQVRILGDSEVAVESMATYANARVFDSRLLVSHGRTETIAPTDRDAATRFELRTRAGVTSVRGTVFRVAASSGDEARTEVVRGRVSAGNETGSVTVDAGFGTVMAAGRPPAPPVALLPAPRLDALPDALVRMPVRVTFPEVPGAIGYRVQVAANTEFSPLLFDVTTAAPAAELPDLPDGPYAIRVRGVDVHGLEGADAVRDVLISARPPAPIPEAPAHDALIDAAPPTFAWTPDGPAGRLRYRFQIARDAAFADLAEDVRDLAAPEYAPAAGLAPGVWHWRIAASHEIRGDGPFGEVRRVRRPAPAPAPAEVSRTPETLGARWPAGPIRVTLTPEDPPAAPVAEALVDGDTWSVPRPTPGRYRLTSRTVESDGFEGPETTSQSIVVPPPPGPPLAVAPADGAELDAAPEALTWQAPVDDDRPVRYRLQIEGPSDTPAPMPDRDGLASPAAAPGPLAPGHYRWRVAASTSEDGAGAFGPWSTFRVLSPPPGDPTVARSPDTLSIRWPDPAPLQMRLRAEDGPVVFEGPVTGGATAMPRPRPGRYILGARTLEADGFAGRHAADFAFDLPAPPAPPVPPAATGVGVVSVAASRPELRWTGSPPGAGHRVQIARDTAFALPVTDTLLGTDTAHVPASELPPGTYHWRVAAVTAQDGIGHFSEPRTFRVEVPAPTMQPVRRVRGELVSAWHTTAPAGSYELQLAPEATFAAPVVNLRTSTPDATFAAPPPGRYFARVRGLDHDGQPGPYSEAVPVKIPTTLPWWLYPFMLFGLLP